MKAGAPEEHNDTPETLPHDLLRSIEIWQKTTLSDMGGFSLNELLGLRKGLRGLGDDLHPIAANLGISESDISLIISQAIVKRSLLEARAGVLNALDNRIQLLGNRAGTPPLSQMADRHEDPLYIPPNYPNWSERKWRSVAHLHRKAMREIAYNERLLAWKQERREEEEKIEKEGQLSRLISVLEQRRDILREENQRRSEEIAYNLSKTIRNEAMENIAILGFYSYAGAFLDCELYFALDYNLYRRSKEPGKKNRKFYDQVIDILQKELGKRGLSYDKREVIRQGHVTMTEGERETFINQVISD
ncbi:MAG: hypothetical protein HHAS10_05390 [Candidatus Altimarinota bacterium]